MTVRGVGALTATLTARYSPGGDIYEEIRLRYGSPAADRVLNAYLSDTPGAVAEELSKLRFGAPGQTSTGAIFTEQIFTDPFGAPLEAANTAIGNVAGSAVRGVLTNPWVLFALLAAGTYFFWPSIRSHLPPDLRRSFERR